MDRALAGASLQSRTWVEDDAETVENGLSYLEEWQELAEAHASQSYDYLMIEFQV